MNPEEIIRILSCSESELFRLCRAENFQGSGPGGQRRNRVYSGVRLTHILSGAASASCISRETALNRKTAMASLRLQFALKAGDFFHEDAETPAGPLGMPDSWPPFRARINPGHYDFPNCAFSALFSLGLAEGSISGAGSQLEVSGSALTRFLRLDKRVWQAAAKIRTRFGRTILK